MNLWWTHWSVTRNQSHLSGHMRLWSKYHISEKTGLIYNPMNPPVHWQRERQRERETDRQRERDRQTARERQTDRLLGLNFIHRFETHQHTLLHHITSPHVSLFFHRQIVQNSQRVWKWLFVSIGLSNTRMCFSGYSTKFHQPPLLQEWWDRCLNKKSS